MKKTKLEVDYRPGSQRKHCGKCTMWRGPNGCTAVAGSISPNGVCDIYEERK